MESVLAENTLTFPSALSEEARLVRNALVERGLETAGMGEKSRIYIQNLPNCEIPFRQGWEPQMRAAQQDGLLHVVVPTRREVHMTIGRFEREDIVHDLLETLLPEAEDATCLVRKTVFEAVGGFPERLIAGGEGPALRGGVSRPSRNACRYTLSAPRAAASLMAANICSSWLCTPPGESRPKMCTAPPVATALSMAVA